ncbi:MAG: hypothetical protein HYT94_03310 [Parcubacteria group bacterium]|nr:hypothetical protein [Parcubacteria group bacterium]
MPNEKTPFDLAKASTPENRAIHDEEKIPLPESAEVKKLIPGARYVYAAHTNNVVPRVEDMIRQYGTFENFPEDEVKKLAYHFGDQTAMIKALVLVIKGEDEKL